MKKQSFIKKSSAFLLPAALLAVAVPAQAQQQLARTIAPTRQNVTDLGLVSPSEEGNVTVFLNMHNKLEFDAAVEALYDPASPTYRKWMTGPALVKYAPTAAEISVVQKELEKHGLTILSVDPDNFFGSRARHHCQPRSRAFPDPHSPIFSERQDVQGEPRGSAPHRRGWQSRVAGLRPRTAPRAADEQVRHQPAHRQEVRPDRDREGHCGFRRHQQLHHGQLPAAGKHVHVRHAGRFATRGRLLRQRIHPRWQTQRMKSRAAIPLRSCRATTASQPRTPKA